MRLIQAVAAERPVRSCADCGKPFRGDRTKCWACSSAERSCADCGKPFRGAKQKCWSCLTVERVCACGRSFRSASNTRCGHCRMVSRECVTCGKPFKSASNLACMECLRVERECVTCGKPFRGATLACWPCQATDRTCADCGKRFRAAHLKCAGCRRESLGPEIREAQERSRRNRRRARKSAAEVSGPVPASVYAAIRASGPCVYCGAAAQTVEHIVPLARGGWEHPDNLVPACGPCNSSKSAKLLAEWDPERVAYAIEASEKVAQAWRARDAREADALGVEIGAPILAGAWLWHAASGVVEYGEVCSLADRVIRYEYEITDEPSSAP